MGRIKCAMCDKPATHIYHCEEHYKCEDCGARENLCTYSEAVLCATCHKKRVEERIKAFQGDTKYTDEVICPYCGYKHIDSWEMSAGVDECVDCGREFRMERYESVSYSTTKMPG